MEVMSNFMPHGHCYFWEPYILWSHALSDSIIALAYMVIPISLFYIYVKRRDFIYGWMVALFALFIFGCGITHIFDVINIWTPIYRIDSIARVITAIASVGTAVVLFKYTPNIISLPTMQQWLTINEELKASNEEYLASNEELQAAIEQLKIANDEIKRLSEQALQLSQNRYKELADSISDIFFALDTDFCFTYWNKASEDFSGIKAEEAIGKSLYDLFPEIIGSELEQFYKNVMQEGEANKFKVHLGRKYGNHKHEVNAYPTKDGLTVITVDITELLNAQELADIQSKERELALWGSGAGRWEYHPAKKEFYYDDRYAKITDNPTETSRLKFEEWFCQIHPEDAPSIIQKLQDHIAEKTSAFQAQYRVLITPQKHKWIMSNGKKVTSADNGKEDRIVGVTLDISEIKKTEEANRFFKHVIDHTNDAIYWIDPYDNFRFSYVNQATCRHFGLSVEKLLKMSIPDWDPTFTYNDCEAIWENIKKEQSLTFETIHTTASGELIPVEITANYLKYADKEFITGYIKDIREQRSYQNKILELQQRLEGIIDSAMDAIISTDENQNIVIYNKAAESMFGYSEADIIGQPLAKLLPFRHQSAHHQHMVAFGKSGKSNRKMGDQRAIFGVDNNGQEFPIEASISQTIVENQKFFTVIMRDVSLRLKREQQRKALNRELVRQNEQLQQFGYITSHNLRGPVATILGLIDVFEMDNIEDPHIKEVCKNMKVTTEKMDEILKDLNQILQYQSNLTTKYEWIDLNQVINNVKIVLASHISKSGAEIISDLAVKQIFSNKSYLNSIFHNLISNAIKYKDSKRPPIIHISVHQEGDYIRLEFTDNGIGIDLKRNKEKIFQMYKRFHPHAEGKGLGLYLVKTQVEALNGDVQIKSVLGEGTTFTILLPLHEQELPQIDND